jgi:hypothetical protein
MRLLRLLATAQGSYLVGGVPHIHCEELVNTSFYVNVIFMPTPKVTPINVELYKHWRCGRFPATGYPFYKKYFFNPKT